MLTAISIVVSYFSGPMLNFGDFSRYCQSFSTVKWGNFWGLPVNFMAFSLVTVITTSATVPVFGKLMTDPVETVSHIDSPTAVVLGALTFLVATIGINIVANFVSPAFDFSNVVPKLISWRAGGMIAIALILAALIAGSPAMLPALSGLANFSWFIGMFCGAFFYFLLAGRRTSA
jgi:NCS1 family nucleobase:cation symporter-1